MSGCRCEWARRSEVKESDVSMATKNPRDMAGPLVGEQWWGIRQLKPRPLEVGMEWLWKLSQKIGAERPAQHSAGFWRAG